MTERYSPEIDSMASQHEPGLVYDLLNDLRLVGETKPLGNMPVDTLISYGQNPDGMIQEAKNRGLSALMYQPDHTHYQELVVYDPQALGLLLDHNRALLEKYQWPIDPEGFARKTSTEIIPAGTPLYDLIADAFGDTDNPGRMGRQETDAAESGMTLA